MYGTAKLKLQKGFLGSYFGCLCFIQAGLLTGIIFYSSNEVFPLYSAKDRTTKMDGTGCR